MTYSLNIFYFIAVWITAIYNCLCSFGLGPNSFLGKMSLDLLATASKVERPSAAVCLKLKVFDFEIVSVKTLLVILKENFKIFINID